MALVFYCSCHCAHRLNGTVDCGSGSTNLPLMKSAVLFFELGSFLPFCLVFLFCFSFVSRAERDELLISLRLVGRSFVGVDGLISGRSGLARCCFVVSVRCFCWRLGEVRFWPLSCVHFFLFPKWFDCVNGFDFFVFFLHLLCRFILHLEWVFGCWFYWIAIGLFFHYLFVWFWACRWVGFGLIGFSGLYVLGCGLLV